MNEKFVNFGVAMEEQFALAKEEGVARPTLLFLDPASAAARAIFEEVRGEPLLPTTHGGGAYMPLVRVSLAAAQGLLRRHAGEAGDSVARHLGTDPTPHDYWIVMAMNRHVGFRAMKDHRVLAGGQVPYDNVPRQQA